MADDFAASLLSKNMDSNQIKQLSDIWSKIVKPILESAKSFTNVGTDKEIDALAKEVDLICVSSNPDVSSYCQQWSSYSVRELLKMIQNFSMSNISQAIDKFISISDNFCF